MKAGIMGKTLYVDMAQFQISGVRRWVLPFNSYKTLGKIVTLSGPHLSGEWRVN